MLWKLILGLLSIFSSLPTEGQGHREVLEPWDLSSWTYEVGKPQPCEPQTPAERSKSIFSLGKRIPVGKPEGE
ncbi:hypothetical protein AVEN_99897-1, partial [Araneus ventricosus]